MAASRLLIPADESISLIITHSNIASFSSEVRFSLQMTVQAVKEKLWRKTGTAVESMRLELKDGAGIMVCELDDDTRPLGFYSPSDGCQLHIIDLDPSSITAGGWLDDASQVEKFKLSDEAYNKRDTNFRKFKEKMISQNVIAAEKKLPENYMEELCANIKVGDRCEVEPGAKRGTVKFVGKSEGLGPGFWVGIQYDEPLGKHDGLVKGVRLFQCPPGHGAVVRPDKVKVGEFPEFDPFEEI